MNTKSKSSEKINWKLCLICQKRTRDPLKNPTIKGYTSLAKDLDEFAKLNDVPHHLKREKLLEEIIENRSKYHKGCRTKFDRQKINRLSQKKKEEDLTDTSSPGLERFTRSQLSTPKTKSYCFFCDEEDDDAKLTSAATLDIGQRLFEKAVFLNDNQLLAKLTNNKDLVALDAKYHKRCYAAFLNRVRKEKLKNETSENSESGKVAYGSILSELLSFMQESFLNSEEVPIFYLSNLMNLLNKRLEQLGYSNVNINRTRLKEQLLALVPGLREDKVGKTVVLTFENDVRNIIQLACEKDSLSDGMCLARAAKILREDMFKEYPEFDGSFAGNFKPTHCVSPQLVTFFKMLLEGATTGQVSDNDETEIDNQINTNAALSLAQLARFNCTKKERTERITSIRHSLQKETPLPLYIGLMLHNQTGRADIIDKLFNLGLSVSYDRVKHVLNSVTGSICEHFTEQDCVCPPSAVNNVFTCAAIDNIDHNTSSNTSIDTFHGTSISLIQYIPEDKAPTPPVSLDLKKPYPSKSLPSHYTMLPPTPKFVSEIPMSLVNTKELSKENAVVEKSPELSEWLKYGRMFAECDNFTPWASYFSQKDNSVQNKCKTMLLPLINEDINSTSVVRHATNIVTSIVHKINPGQITVITADQPVYALLKSLQWAMPNEYGEHKIMVMLGGLHIEMALASAIGTWLEGSGWTDNLIDAHITTSGRAEAILKVFHVKKSRYAHEVSLATLQILMERAFDKQKDESLESFESWICRKSEESVQFKYWRITMELESLLLTFVRSIRQGDYESFICAIEKICPWMFALDHINYARWLPVFLNNLKQLPEMHPDLFQEFRKGKMFGSKTNKKFSRMAHDHLHEQNNKLVKNTSINLSRLSQEHGLIQWMVAGPEVARMVKEFEDNHSRKFCTATDKHHEDTESFRKRFQAHVSALVEVYEEYGNPFEDDELTTVNNNRIVLPQECSISITLATARGMSQFNSFVEDRLILRKVSIHDVIKRNNFPLMTVKKGALKSKDKEKIFNLRKDSTLFAKLYVACQARKADIKEFFSYENSPCPPSISDLGKLRKPSKKSDIVSCIVQSSGVSLTTLLEPKVTSLIIDAAALVHMLVPQSNKTVQQYLDQNVRPYILKRLESVDRIDLVFDRYLERSIKNDTRQSRGTGPRINIKSNVMIPKSFKNFLSHNKNKEDLFCFLAINLVQMELPTGKQLVCTYKEKVVGSNNISYDMISPTSHEEADARLLLHARHATENSGHSKVTIKTVDSDVVVICMYAFFKMPKLEELWVEYGSGKHLQYIPIHNLCRNVPQGVPELLPFFHAFTGADTVSSFSGIGKITAWRTWMSFREVDKAFLEYSRNHDSISEDDETFLLIQRFVVLMYHSSSSSANVNDARRILFTQQNRSIENIPPTSNALFHHLKRSVLQCTLWTNCLQKNFQPKDPCSWGWKKSGDDYEPLWLTNSEITMEKLQELTSCKCKERCARCKCVKAGLTCTLLCSCEGQCSD